METEVKIPPHEKVKQDLASKFNPTSTYLGSHIKKTIIESDFKPLKQNQNAPTYIKKADVIIVQEGVKRRPAVVIKVLKDRTVMYVSITSSENIHCMGSFNSRFFGEGCFCKSFNVCTEEFAIENFIMTFDDTKSLNLAIKELKEFINKNI